MPRRIRILCLHGQDQSAASLRAATRLIADKLERHWEMHYLDAPFLVPDHDEADGIIEVADATAVGTEDQWRRAAFLVSALVALRSDVDSFKSRDLMTPTDTKIALQSVTHELDTFEEGRAVVRAAEKAGIDLVESMVSRKSAKSLNRGWTVTIASPKDSSSSSTPPPLLSGLGMSLQLLSDYLRETGTFHGVIGYGSGADIAWLMQTMLSHPRSSANAFPTFFPRLPKGASRMPRMGGWEEEPPPLNDPRLGDENLPSTYAPTQEPLEFVVAYRPHRGQGRSVATFGEQTQEFVRTKSLLALSQRGAFTSHSLELVIEEGSIAPLSFSSTAQGKVALASFPPDLHWANYLVQWFFLAVQSCSGDREAAGRIAMLPLPDSRKSKM